MPLLRVRRQVYDQILLLDDSKPGRYCLQTRRWTIALCPTHVETVSGPFWAELSPLLKIISFCECEAAVSRR